MFHNQEAYRQTNSIRPVPARMPAAASVGKQAMAFVDNRPRAAIQQKIVQGMFHKNQSTTVVQRKTNNTGLPEHLKNGIENLSGISMNDVKVNYNSPKPAQLQAHAYAQGTDIHIGPGQEKHLPHEAWHVVQQKQGRVQPTKQLKSKININDDKGLEQEADVMGAKAVSAQEDLYQFHTITHAAPMPVVQRALTVTAVDYNPVIEAQNVGVHPDDQANPYINADLNVATFVHNINGYLLPNGNAQAYPAGNAILSLAARQAIYPRLGQLAGNNLAGADMQQLSTAIRDHLQSNTALSIGERARFLVAVGEALPAPTRLNAGEAGDFETMVQNAGGGSKSKGAPTAIQSAQLPDGIQQQVALSVAAIQNRNNIIVGLGDEYADVTIHSNLGSVASQNFATIRTTHANGAGWLPAVVIPGNVSVNTLRTAIEARLPSKTRKRANKDEQDQQGNYFTGSQRKIYTREMKAVLTGLASDRERLMAVWGAYSEGVGGRSAYVEFAVNHPRLNRLVYDFVNGRIYVTFHYNWHKGYNPFFRISDAGDGY